VLRLSHSGHPLEHGRRDVGRAGRDLVALARAFDVLHEEREPPRLGLDLRRVDGWQPGGDAGGDLAVEADLYLVGPQCEPGATTLLVGRRELAHDTRRTGARSVVGEAEARRVGHLARPDG
jgi:hypothetical protein